MRPVILIALTILLVACGTPSVGAPSPTPFLPHEAASATAQSLVQAPQTTDSPGVSDIVATPPSAGPGATPTDPSLADAATATALTAGGLAPPATRTPVQGITAALPAPLYLRSIVVGQVLRVERDQVNYREITFEPQPVLELAVPARAGGIFYLTGDPDGDERTLVALSGTGRDELFFGKLSALTVTPDGSTAFVRIVEPEPGLIIGQDEAPTGIWIVYREGGRPGFLIADTPADDVFDAEAPAWSYIPLAVSPDGRRLAAFAYDQDGPGLPGGELVIFDLQGQGEPLRIPTCCEAPVWSADSQSLLVAGGGPAPDTRYGLYRVDAATGVETPLLTEDDRELVPLVTAPYTTPSGDLLALVDLPPAATFSWEHPFRPAIARLGPDETLTVNSGPLPAPEEVLWAEDGKGALISAPGPDLMRPDPLIWQSSAGGPPNTIYFEGADLAWVPANAPLNAGSCDTFTTLSYQPPATRQRDPAVADLQARLLAFDYEGGPPDGLYGEQTRAGVIAFQQTRGLQPSGDVDCATWQALLATP